MGTDTPREGLPVTCTVVCYFCLPYRRYYVQNAPNGRILANTELTNILCAWVRWQERCRRARDKLEIYLRNPISLV